MKVGYFVIIFFGLLGGLLIGMLGIFMNFNYFFEILLLKIIGIFEKGYMVDLVKNNLISHRFKNRRTIITLALGLSFINFIYAMFLINVQMAVDRNYQRKGGDIILVNSNNGNLFPNIKP
jgi:hypothetical protein